MGIRAAKNEPKLRKNIARTPMCFSKHTHSRDEPQATFTTIILLFFVALTCVCISKHTFILSWPWNAYKWTCRDSLLCSIIFHCTCFERTALKHVYHLGWNRSPAQAGCMKQVLGPGALGRPRGIGRGRWEGGSGWRIHVNPWLIHVNVWQKPLQYCKVISLQLIKINEKKKEVTKWKWNL